MIQIPFTATTKDLNRAAVILAAESHVEIYRQPSGRRALFTFIKSPATRNLIYCYERRDIHYLPTKTILSARNQLYHYAVLAIRESS